MKHDGNKNTKHECQLHETSLRFLPLICSIQVRNSFTHFCLATQSLRSSKFFSFMPHWINNSAFLNIRSATATSFLTWFLLCICTKALWCYMLNSQVLRISFSWPLDSPDDMCIKWKQARIAVKPLCIWHDATHAIYARQRKIWPVMQDSNFHWTHARHQRYHVEVIEVPWLALTEVDISAHLEHPSLKLDASICQVAYQNPQLTGPSWALLLHQEEIKLSIPDSSKLPEEVISANAHCEWSVSSSSGQPGTTSRRGPLAIWSVAVTCFSFWICIRCLQTKKSWT